MDTLSMKAKNNQDFAERMSDLLAFDRAIELSKEASRMLEVSACLRNQMNRNVPFYEGKATCAMATAGDS